MLLKENIKFTPEFITYSTGHLCVKFIKSMFILQTMAKFRIKNNKLVIDKKITKLDEFVLETVGIAGRYADYVIIGGYVSIFFGRARATEDIDVFIEKIDFDKFSEMIDEFNHKKFEFNIDDKKSLYHDYLSESLPINVWRKNFPLLRLEIRFALKKTQKSAIESAFTAIFSNKKLRFGQIESQIAYKRYILKSEKDLEDARHLELVFEGLNQQLTQKYKKEFEYELEHGK